MTKYKVALVDDEKLIRQGLKMILEQGKKIEITNQAENGKVLLDQIDAGTFEADVILLDLSMPVMDGIEASDALRNELQQWVRKEIGPIAKPDLIQWAPGLPKTRSGKIMRRILRKVAADDYGELGDTSTLADPSVVSELIENRQNRS